MIDYNNPASVREAADHYHENTTVLRQIIDNLTVVKSLRTEHQARVEDFMLNVAQQIVPDVPTIPSDEICLLRAKLILEEAFETIEALGYHMEMRMDTTGLQGHVPVYASTKGHAGVQFIRHNRPVDIKETADGCADISVVTIGTLSAFGIKDRPLLEEVDRSNLDKKRGHKEPSGKWMKPPDWVKPDINKVLEDQGYVFPEEQSNG